MEEIGGKLKDSEDSGPSNPDISKSLSITNNRNNC